MRNAELAEELRQSHKMQALGQMAGGIVHNFNNLLLAVSGNVERIADNLGRTPFLCLRSVEQLRRAVEMGSSLTRRLRAFCRKQPSRFVAIKPSEALAGMVQMLQGVLGSNIHLVMEEAAPCSYIFADAGQVEEAILNLILNARDAMPQGGTVRIATGDEIVDETSATEKGLPPGPYACISVTDSGVGMDEETRSHLFEPFFTTKPLGQGAGLGLSTVYGFVKQVNGSIEVDSEPGKGTTFRIRIPTVAPSSPVASEGCAAPASAAGCNLLLCEDDPVIRELLADFLSNNRCAVIQAESAEEALELVDGRAEPLDVLVADIHMGTKSGFELARELQARYPSIRCVLISGHPASIPDKQADLGPSTVFMSKPFQFSDLLRAIVNPGASQPT